jgi:hypothetical protein
MELLCSSLDANHQLVVGTEKTSVQGMYGIVVAATSINRQCSSRVLTL